MKMREARKVVGELAQGRACGVDYCMRSYDTLPCKVYIAAPGDLSGWGHGMTWEEAISNLKKEETTPPPDEEEA